MKKILFFLYVVFLGNQLSAQTFEGAHMMPEFAKEIPIKNVDLTGKILWSVDYEPFKTVSTPILSKIEAFNLALLLIRAPKELELKKGIANVIRSYDGFVNIFYSQTIKTWVLNFHPGIDIVNTGEKPMRFIYFK